MSSPTGSTGYVALLRGINVGGHHKVPMADLRKTLTDLGLTSVVTLLNSGNVIFTAAADRQEELENTIADRLEQTFGFPIPTLIRTTATILQLYAADPFRDIALTKDIRRYVSFSPTQPTADVALPWTSPDGSFTILTTRDKAIISVLDLAVAPTPKAMEALERLFGSGITTRNWNTIERIVRKL